MSTLLGNLIDERYELLEQLGSGGMGTVYRAKQHPFEREVALKMLHDEMPEDSETLARFEREALAISKLKHKNIVMFYGYGVFRGAPYMVIELVDGDPLWKLLHNDILLDTQYTLRIVEQVAEGLSCAHTNGLVHRDLKPSNIMIVHDETSLQVKVIDFGLARMLPSFGKDVQKLTDAGHAVGSVLYMSPEQCVGATTDARSDIYALGCIMHHCLTGEPPFDAEHSVVVMQHHLSDPLPRMPHVAPDLQAIVDRATQKDRDDRYQTMGEMLQDVRALLTGRSVADETKDALKHATPAPSEAIAKPHPKRRTVARLCILTSMIAAMAVAGYIIGFGLGYGSGGASRMPSANEDDSIWVLKRQAANEMQVRHDHEAMQLYERVLALDEDKPRLLNVDERDESVMALVALYLRNAEYTKARTLASKYLASAGRRISSGPMGRDLVTRLMQSYDALGEKQQALKFLIDLVDEMQRKDRPGWEPYAGWAVGRMQDAGRAADALAYGKRAITASSSQPDLMVLCAQTAGAANADGKPDESKKLLQQAEKIADGYDFTDPQFLHVLGNVKMSLGKFSEARSVLEEATANPEAVPTVVASLAECEVRLGDYAEAAKSFRNTLAIASRREQPESHSLCGNVVLGCDRSIAWLKAHGKTDEIAQFTTISDEAKAQANK